MTNCGGRLFSSFLPGVSRKRLGQARFARGGATGGQGSSILTHSPRLLRRLTLWDPKCLIISSLLAVRCVYGSAQALA